MAETGFSITEFMGKFKSGARNYLFMIRPQFPGSLTGVTMEEATYLVRASSLPGRTIEPIEIPWQGTTYKIGGKSTTEDWTITFNVDQNAAVYQTFLDWADSIHNHETNIHGNPEDYFADQEVMLLNPTTGTSILTVKLIGAWPSTVAAIDLGYENAEVAQFDVTFAYQYHEWNA